MNFCASGTISKMTIRLEFQMIIESTRQRVVKNKNIEAGGREHKGISRLQS